MHNVTIDQVGHNADHFASLKREDAVAAIAAIPAHVGKNHTKILDDILAMRAKQIEVEKEDAVKKQPQQTPAPAASTAPAPLPALEK